MKIIFTFQDLVFIGAVAAAVLTVIAIFAMAFIHSVSEKIKARKYEKEKRYKKISRFRCR